jgi:tight adherence protein C
VVLSAVTLILLCIKRFRTYDKPMLVDGIVIAVERGTPLADVLRAQAQDVREAGRRAVMEQGGKKEIAMMIPVVFVVLPVTVLFAIYPGVAFLKLSI